MTSQDGVNIFRAWRMNSYVIPSIEFTACCEWGEHFKEELVDMELIQELKLAYPHMPSQLTR